MSLSVLSMESRYADRPLSPRCAVSERRCRGAIVSTARGVLARQATIAALRPTPGVRKEAIERSGTPLPSGIIPVVTQRVVRPVIRSRSNHSPGSGCTPGRRHPCRFTRSRFRLRMRAARSGSMIDANSASPLHGGRCAPCPPAAPRTAYAPLRAHRATRRRVAPPGAQSSTRL